MIDSPDSSCRPKAKRKPRRVGLEEVLQSLRLVLEMEPDHLDGAIDLLDAAIHNDRRPVPKLCGCQT